jgi:hypothetical protein
LVYSSSPAPWLVYVAVISAKERVNNLERAGTAFEIFLLNFLCPGIGNIVLGDWGARKIMPRLGSAASPTGEPGDLPTH